MGKIAKYLNQLTVGNVFDSPEVLKAYSTDHSALEIKPKFVAFPESTEDIQKLMRFFNQLVTKEISVPITVRGAGNDKTGAALSNGIIISTEKLNHLLEIDPRERLVRVQAGITLKELNTALSVSGLTIPIKDCDNDTIGGLISNDLTDNYAGKYQGIQNYVARLEVVLATGEILQTERYKKYAFAKKAAEKSPEGELYRKIAKLLIDKEPIINEIEKIDIGKTGYPNLTKIKKRDSHDLTPLFFGAQGTLGIISEVILKAVPLKEKPVRVLATFKNIERATLYMDTIKDLKPCALNLYDLKIVEGAKETGKNLDGVIRRFEDGFVVFASFDERRNYNLKKILALKETMPRGTKFIFESPENRQTLNEFENTLINYLNYVKNGERVPILTDFYLPPYNLKGFLKDLDLLAKKLELDLNLYGSYSTSIYSLRPKFDLEDENFNKKATAFLRAGAFIIERQGGTLTGGTPEGRLKAVVTNQNLPDDRQAIYEEIKKLFDKNHILNPDVKLGASSKFTLTHFRNTNQPKVMI